MPAAIFIENNRNSKIKSLSVRICLKVRKNYTIHPPHNILFFNNITKEQL